MTANQIKAAKKMLTTLRRTEAQLLSQVDAHTCAMLWQVNEAAVNSTRKNIDTIERWLAMEKKLASV